MNFIVLISLTYSNSSTEADKIQSKNIRPSSFLAICNSFLDLTLVRGFVNYFRIIKKLFVDPIILLRFVIVFFRFYKLFNNDLQKKNYYLKYFFGFENTLGLSLIGFRTIALELLCRSCCKLQL